MLLTREKFSNKLNLLWMGKLQLFLMCSRLGLNKDNAGFTDFLSSDIGSQIFRENLLSIHIETRNIFYDNYNTNESI